MLRLILSLMLFLSSAAVAAAPLRVMVSVLPQKTLVERVGGSEVEVQAMVQPGHSPATYDPSPRQMADLAQMDFYYRVGVPFEHAWMPKLRRLYPELPVIDAREGLDLRRIEAHSHGEHEDHDHDHGQEEVLDPHLWASPRMLLRMAEGLRDELSRRRPEAAGRFERNFAQLAAELRELDAELHQRLDKLQHRRFMVFHPAWGYFADEYGLTQVAVERNGKEPGGQQLALLMERARADGVRLILVQPQFSRRSAEAVAKAVGARLLVLDSLSEDLFGPLRRLAVLLELEDR